MVGVCGWVKFMESGRWKNGPESTGIVEFEVNKGMDEDFGSR